jgi:hypothetical protein
MLPAASRRLSVIREVAALPLGRCPGRQARRHGYLAAQMGCLLQLRQIDRLTAIPRDESTDSLLVGITRNEPDSAVREESITPRISHAFHDMA